MGTVPFTFEPNQTISSQQVNANFDFIIGSIIGGIITDEVEFLKDIVFGDRQNHVLGGAHDTNALAPSRAFTMLSWNAKFKDQGGGNYKWIRINTGEPATVAKIGQNGFEIATTSETSGSLDPQLNTVFAVRATTGDNTDYFYMAKGWSIISRDGGIDNVEDYRTTVVWLENDVTPLELVQTNLVSKNKGLWVLDMRENGISQFAKSIMLVIYGKGGAASSACRIYMERVVRHKALGVSLFVDATKEGQAQGEILLGRGPRAGKIVIENTASFNTLSILIQGYTI